ncbi:PIN2/TERF1-interacting telomerase inhibitor 1-like isoform X3 [Dromaius novaehollandiae]|uniref:PIN2/TERF1-interacting telomerase inhibitor 1-like isoform X3 n=1 Tax=Dromaius novaehollandiae TaxID=8790 RepID=UPI00311D43BC
MAMLAEPRRRQKWSVDPRNSAWSKDESKFGQKMLEKMGWSKGKGLGAQEQGNTEHIKVHVKNNMLGLGATINHEDNWIAHQDDFNQLLAELNDCHGQGETGNTTEDWLPYLQDPCNPNPCHSDGVCEYERESKLQLPLTSPVSLDFLLNSVTQAIRIQSYDSPKKIGATQFSGAHQHKPSSLRVRDVSQCRSMETCWD